VEGGKSEVASGELTQVDAAPDADSQRRKLVCLRLQYREGTVTVRAVPLRLALIDECGRHSWHASKCVKPLTLTLSYLLHLTHGTDRR